MNDDCAALKLVSIGQGQALACKTTIKAGLQIMTEMMQSDKFGEMAANESIARHIHSLRIGFVTIKDAITGRDNHDPFRQAIQQRIIEITVGDGLRDIDGLGRIFGGFRFGRQRLVGYQITLDQHLQQVAIAPDAATIIGFLIQQIECESELHANRRLIAPLASKYSLDERINFPVDPRNRIVVFLLDRLAKIRIFRPEQINQCLQNRPLSKQREKWRLLLMRAYPA